MFSISTIRELILTAEVKHKDAMLMVAAREKIQEIIEMRNLTQEFLYPTKSRECYERIAKEANDRYNNILKESKNLHNA